jgi:hypothetical protein
VASVLAESVSMSDARSGETWRVDLLGGGACLRWCTLLSFEVEAVSCAVTLAPPDFYCPISCWYSDFNLLLVSAQNA